MSTLLHGDCLEILPTLEAESIDAIVTDPPYGLSDNRFYGCRSLFAEIGFPKDKDGYSQMMTDINFFVPAVDSSSLRRINSPIRKNSGVSVPKSSVDFKNSPITQHKVNDSGISTAIVSDGGLSDVRNAQAVKHDRYLVFKFGGSDIGSIADIPATSGAYLFPGGFAHPVIISLSPSSNRLLCGESPFASCGFRPVDDKGTLADSRRKSERSASILAGGGAIRIAMLRFDVRGCPVELDITDRTSHLFASTKIPPAELVGAISRTGDLPTMLESHRVRIVSDLADGTYSVDLLLPRHDSIITATGFMGKRWDGSNSEGLQYFSSRWARECLRVLKPGGYLLAFGATRTYGRLQCGIEDAGFESRDTIAHIFAQGFPKSMDISKQIDKMKGMEREIVGENPNSRENVGDSGFNIAKKQPITKPASEEAKEWDGWGTALKPAMELIVVARKPISEKTIAENVLKHGTGGINVDACRVPVPSWDSVPEFKHEGKDGGRRVAFGEFHEKVARTGGEEKKGRWPANATHDGSDEVIDAFPKTGPGGDIRGLPERKETVVYSDLGKRSDWDSYGDFGSAARFFYCSKASKAEREAGLEDMPEKTFGMSGGAQSAISRGEEYTNSQDIGLNRTKKRRNIHNTVKPIKLMRWLVRMVTPKDGVILDPFMGSGTTGIAAFLEDVQFIGIEKEKEYFEIAKHRIAHAESNRQPEIKQGNLFDDIERRTD